MGGTKHRIGEDRVVESGRLRFAISGAYVAFAMDGEPVYVTEGPLQNRRIVSGPTSGDSTKILGENEWSPSMRMLPAWVDFEYLGENGPDLHCRIELREDVPRVVEFGWRSTQVRQEEIRQKHLRSISVEGLAETVYGTWVIELRDVSRESVGQAALPGAGLSPEQERLIHGLLQDMRTGRRYVDADLLRQVAEVYRANFDRAPTEAVARAFGVKPRMASEYVARARKRGFLPETKQGQKKA
ncbi:hypothetical protein BH09ACT8_BH09ACT8_59170 [soil metagenome]